MTGGRRTGLATALAVALASPLFAQSPYVLPPEEGGLIRSMGMPPTWRWYATASSGSAGSGVEGSFMANAEMGVYRDLLHPALGILGWNAEAYTGLRSGDPRFDFGGRLLLESPVFRLSAGLDAGVEAGVDPILRFKLPLRRGGFLARGGTVQLNYLPTRGHAWHAGFTIPLAQPWRGRTRPRDIRLRMQTPDPPEALPTGDYLVREALINAREAATWITNFTIPPLDRGGMSARSALDEFREALQELASHMGSANELYPDGRTRNEEIRVFHAEIERAFAMAASDVVLEFGETGPWGAVLGRVARRFLLDELILPYNRLLGQYRRNDTSRGFARQAEEAFATWLVDEPTLTEARRPAVQYVFRQLLEIAERERGHAVEEWGDSRLGWIPLQLGLLPVEHDTRAELDDIIARAVGKPWTNGNRFWYVRNAQFLWELAYSVRRTRDYHVLWIHDIAAVNAAGQPDFVTHMGMVDFYFEALTRAVRSYDERGVMPLFLIFNDQLFYEDHQSRLWLDVLENPLEVAFDFPEDFDYPEGAEDPVAAFETAQQALRDAVAGSARLQEGAAKYGPDWLRNRVKIHVNITNPADPSYNSNMFLPVLGWPDDVMRDHRKIAFYDLSEDDPYSGMAMYSGMGIGEHYAGPTWEDRSVLVQGPALISLKQAAYDLMLEQGFEPAEIPEQLRPREPSPETVATSSLFDPSGWGRGMEIHNATGHGDKALNVAKAVLYTLMPPGSVMISPDSLWNGSFWASLLMGNALSGGRVFIIAPSLQNAPGAAGFLAMSRTQELFARLIVVEQQLGDQIAAAGGMIKTGVYDTDISVSDLPGSVKLVLGRVAATPWLAELLPFDERLLTLLRTADERWSDYQVEFLFEDATPRKSQLHLKSTYFATAEAWEAPLGLPAMAEIFETYGTQQEILERNRAVYTDIRLLHEPLKAAIDDGLGGWVETLEPDVRARFGLYLMVGSANQAYRSLYMDGEANYLATGLDAFLGIFDFIYLLGSSRWMGSLEELEAYLPAQSDFKWILARLIREGI